MAANLFKYCCISALLLMATSCGLMNGGYEEGPPVTYEYECLLDCDLNETARAMMERLRAVGVPEKWFKVSATSDKIRVELSLDESYDLEFLLCSRGRVALWLAHDNSEIGPKLEQLNDFLSPEPYIAVYDSTDEYDWMTDPEPGSTVYSSVLYDVLSANVRAAEAGGFVFVDGPVVGYVAVENVATLDSVLGLPGAMSSMPEVEAITAAVFSFTTAEGESYVELYALAELLDDHLEIAEITPEGEESIFQESSGEGALSIRLAAVEHEAWARNTGRYVGQGLAFLLDGTVLTCPTVNERMENGVAYISGLEDVGNAEVIAAILANPYETRLVPAF